MHPTTPARLALAVVTALTAAACSDAPSTAPAAPRRAPAAAPGANVVPNKQQTLTVCAEGPSGTYSYNMSVSQTSVNDVRLPYGTSFTLGNEECKDVVVIDQAADFTWGMSDPFTNVTITQTSAPSRTSLAAVQKTEGTPDQEVCAPPNAFPCGNDTRESGPAVTTGFNFYRGVAISYWNSEAAPPPPPIRCVASVGYWRTHESAWPAGVSPSAPFFATGKSWLDELSAPPRRKDIDVVLAHQYIAASLNLAAGAPAPFAVRASFDQVTRYFQTGRAYPILPLVVLALYNDGLTFGGPRACR